MRVTYDYKKNVLFLSVFFYTWICIFLLVQITQGSQPVDQGELSVVPYDKFKTDLKAIPFEIIYQKYKENWELFIMNADGSNATNLTLYYSP